MNDPVLTGLALVELVARTGSDPIAEALTLLSEGTCEHAVQALFLAQLVVDISDEVAYPLRQKIAEIRADALAPEPEGGIA